MKRDKVVGAVLSLGVVFMMFSIGYVILNENREAYKKIATNKCDERFGEGNWAWVHKPVVSRQPATCIGLDNGTKYQPEINAYKRYT